VLETFPGEEKMTGCIACPGIFDQEDRRGGSLPKGSIDLLPPVSPMSPVSLDQERRSKNDWQQQRAGHKRGS
jgi:hypothetical protein